MKTTFLYGWCHLKTLGFPVFLISKKEENY